ncbi:sugar ABC transporter substrate-binding protein [Paenibacillus sp. N1-5-1-14]|uniref:ABC transporter substrate-binding protein n=1 Tax=Paenibacillus radicibacter TaxID=2972488 RepID=UPI0021598D1D|nr:sugar ABC transporter substrate-binding protein [Paenibacillus radicibacter]MCR8642537.1 sugar ABC transporter substrate-binding protein [Paenibacillus radicibacter]
MKKTLISVVAVVAMVSVMAGCGSKEPDKGTASSTVPSTTSPSATTTGQATNAAIKGKLTVQMETPDKKTENEQIEKSIERYKAKYPGVQISKDDWKYDPTQIGVKMASHSVPDVIKVYASEGKMLADHNWALDLTPFLNEWKFKNDLNPLMTKSFTVNDKIYGLPLDGYVMTVTINKKLLADKGVAMPPLDWTWDDFFDIAQKVNDPAKGIAGFIPMGKGTESGWNWTNFLFAAGGDIQKVENGKVVTTFNSEAGLQALEFYKKLKDANVIPENWALGYMDALTAFYQGRGAMVLCGSGNAVDTAINQGGMNKDDLAIYPIPSMKKGGKHTGVFGGTYQIISGLVDKEDQPAAFKWISDEAFTEEAINARDAEITSRKEKKQIFVPQLTNYWKEDSEYGKKYNDMIAKHDNVYKYDPQLLTLLEGKPESQFETQKYYAEMAELVQEIFTVKDINLKERMEFHAKKLQEEVFDKIKIQ